MNEIRNVIQRQKLFPYIPIIGILLTAIYHLKYGNTGIEKLGISLLTAFIQAISILAIVFYFAN